MPGIIPRKRSNKKTTPLKFLLGITFRLHKLQKRGEDMWLKFLKS